MGRSRKKAKKEFSKVIVSIVVLLNICFTIAVFYAFLKVGSEPVALIGAWFYDGRTVDAFKYQETES